MMITLVICDPDMEYSTRLMNYFKRGNNYNIETNIFSKIEHLEKFIMDHEGSHYFLLINEKMMIDEEKLAGCKYVFLITEEQDKAKRDQRYLFKYQNVSNILNSIISLYMSEQSSYPQKLSGTSKRILSIFNISNDMYVINFLWLISKLLSQRDKVLIISLELFQFFSSEFSSNSTPNLSELIYYIKENQSIGDKLNNYIIQSDGFDIISGITHSLDLLSLNQEDINKIIGEVISYSNYNIVIFYAGFYSEAMNQVFRKSEKVILPFTNNPYSKILIEDWKRQNELYDQDIKYKTVPLERRLTEHEGLIKDASYSNPLWEIANICYEEIVHNSQGGESN